MARTDARAGLGLEEALERCKEFRRIGADITFLEAPQSEEEMRRYCQEVDGPKLANMLEVRQFFRACYARVFKFSSHVHVHVHVAPLLLVTFRACLREEGTTGYTTRDACLFPRELPFLVL